MPNSRQTRRPSAQSSSGAGVGVDIHGGPAIDPTENVLALVDVERRNRDVLREIDNQRQDELREAEKFRVNCLDGQRKEFEARIDAVVTRYETRIDAITTSSTSANSALLAKQLENIQNILGERITELEKKSWEGSGKTSVLDPATAASLAKIESLVASRDLGTGRTEGVAKVWVTVVTVISTAAAVGAIFAAVAVLLK